MHTSSSYAKQIFTHGSFPEVGQKQKTERKERRRPKVGNNNGQLRIATPPRVAHAKPPGPISLRDALSKSNYEFVHSVTFKRKLSLKTVVPDPECSSFHNNINIQKTNNKLIISSLEKLKTRK